MFFQDARFRLSSPASPSPEHHRLAEADSGVDVAIIVARADEQTLTWSGVSCGTRDAEQCLVRNVLADEGEGIEIAGEVLSWLPVNVSGHPARKTQDRASPERQGMYHVRHST